MKKRTKTLLLTAAIMLLCIVSLAACVPSGDYSAYAAKYYRYINDVKQENQWVELKADKSWTDETSAVGTYEVSGENITISAELFGIKSVFMSGTVKDGTLTVKLLLLGATAIYKKDGAGTGGGTGAGEGEGEELPSWITNPPASVAEMKTLLEGLGYEVEDVTI